MVTLPTFLMVLALLIVRECCRAPVTIGFSATLGFTLVSVLGLGLAARWANRRPFLQMRLWLWSLWLPGLLWGSGWIGWSRGLAQTGWPESAGYLFLFFPSALLALTLERSTSAGSSRRASAEKASSSQGGDARFRVPDALAGLVTCILPVVAVALGVDCLHLLAPHSQILRVLLAAMAVAVALAVLPVWLGRWVGVRPLRGSSLGGRINHYRQQTRIHQIEPYLATARSRFEGAAVVGWLPRTRRLWISDALVERLDRRELDMVVLHELAHIQGHHFLWRITPLAWATSLGLAYSLLSQRAPDSLWATGLAQGGALMACAAILVVGLGHVARNCELEADARACELARKHCWWAGDPGRAESVLAATLTKLLGVSPAATKPSWLHPSLRQRVAHLAKGLAARRLPLPVRDD